MMPSDQSSPNTAIRPWGWVILLAVVAALGLCWGLRPPADAYTRSVLAMGGDAINGRSIFVMNCVPCHGQWADGKVGPSLHGVARHKSKEQLVHQIVSGETPPMPKFQADPQKMADLLAYLNQL